MSLSNAAIVERYFRAIEAGNMAELSAVLSPDIEQVEWPNVVKPHGDRRGIVQLRADFEHGRNLLSSQSYTVSTLTESGERIVAEVLWRGVLAVPLATLQPGDEMKAFSAIVFEFRDGLIVSQRNYDCFEHF